MTQRPARRSTPWLPLIAFALIAALFVQACSAAPAEAPAVDDADTATSSDGPVVNSLGRELPADAAPLDQQVLIYPYNSWQTFTTVDFYENVYQRGGALADLLSDSLVRLDKNFELQPGAALDWSVDDSGLVWTFTLDENLMWNDGTPVTANDYVATFQYGSSPDHAWDFTWYFNGVIANWQEAVGGEVSVEEIGVRAVDDYTLEFTTVSPAPYLPAMLLYSTPLSAAALEESGPLYNSNVETSVSAGPYQLVEWTRDQRLVYEINPDYTGTNVPYIEKLIVLGMGEGSHLAAYEANEIDVVSGGGILSPADMQIIGSDAALEGQYYPHYGDFRTYYFFFDDSTEPFNDPLVRQAFAHMVDRDALIENVVREQGIPSYSMLTDGFPAADSEAYADIYPYNPERARELLAEAGYPDGEGFPSLTLALRAEASVPEAVAQAYASALNQELGIEVQVSNQEFKTFMDALLAEPTEMDFGFISYGMDYLDPANMLGVFESSGRHTWSNAEYDALIDEAASFTGDPAERIEMFQEAERILVEDVGGVFAYHQTPGDLVKPYLVGEALTPDENGVAAWHWPGFSGFSTLMQGIYVSDEVSEYRSSPPQ